ncbi:RdgB/HAM1 family non-canonical purine NTP pyrophosphatase [Pectinatus frisingensis]|uniref:RdgB/HAM1 family non-canonical purine NTP pyrophosphatase n=1 Tax=Pectinatus frisingensis TaxID=865 RepID=UPI002DDB7BE5|nr:RdgB/HAM1 family non-canonical purine NTP pyrophosphatase [Pectinatus frisingensis]
MMKTVVIATKNKGKIKELLEEFTGLPIKVRSLDEFSDLPTAKENGDSFAENALIKAKFYSQQTGMACIADDSGLEIDALNKRPGIYSARFAGEPSDDQANNHKMIDELNNVHCVESSARYKCALVFYDVNGKIFQTEGICEGTIKIVPSGVNGFGYDPYFYLSDKKSMAQLSIREKQIISHRGEAVCKMKKLLAGYLL